MRINRHSFRKLLFLLLTFLVVFTLLVIFNDDNDSKLNNSKLKDKIEFEQIGYYKSVDNMRVFSFYVKILDGLDLDTIPDYVWNSIRGHGLSQMHTNGRATHSYYFTRKSNTPDITLEKHFNTAVDRCYENEPLAVVYKDINGKNGIIKFPK